VVILIALLVWLPRLSGPIDLRWDAGVYYVLGTSLATGHGYRILSEPGSPEALQYPPLLPAIVALHEQALGSTDPAVVGPWLRRSYAILFLFYGLAALALARRYLRVGAAVVAVALSLLQVNTLFNSDLLFTELPFALLSVLFALVAVNGRIRMGQWLREGLSFIFAAAGFLLRTAGLALLVAWVLESLARRQWRLAILRAALALLPVIAWQAHVVRVHRSYEYTHPAYEYQRAPYQFYNVSYADNAGRTGSAHAGSIYSRTGTLVVRLTKNLCRMGKRVGEAISSSQGYWQELLSDVQQSTFRRQIVPAAIVLGPILVLSALVTAGVGILLYRREWLFVFVILVSVGLICTTPWPGQFQRYLMPLTSFLAISALVTLSKTQDALQTGRGGYKRVFGQIALTAIVVLPLLVQTYAALQLFSVRNREGASFVPGRGDVGPRFFYQDLLWRGWEQAIAWIDQNSAPSAIIATPYSHLCYLRTGHHAVSPPVEANPARVRQLLAGVPVSYVIVDRGYSLPAIENDSPGWRLVQSFDGTKLYERVATVTE
jgi:hypothetical protein